MAACDAQSLVSDAACLECGVPPGMQGPVIIYLLCQIAGIKADAVDLIEKSQCLNCNLPPGIQRNIIIFLLCQMASGLPAPVLTAIGGGSISWTWSDPDPGQWTSENSADGVTGWMIFDASAGNIRTDSGFPVGNYVRIVGQDTFGNNTTGISNVVKIT